MRQDLETIIKMLEAVQSLIGKGRTSEAADMALRAESLARFIKDK